MKPCEHLSHYLDGRMESAGRDYFEAHLGVCQDCRNVVDMWTSTKIRLKNEANDRWRVLTPTNDEAARLVERVELERTTRDTWSLRALFPVIVTASVTFALAWVLFGSFEDGAASATQDRVAETPSGGSLRDIENRMIGPSPVVEKVIAEASRHPQIIRYKATETGHTIGQLGEDTFGLGPSSRLSVVSADDDTTRLHLESGSAAFSVARREKGQKFIVEAGNISVKVVGTQFSVDRTGDRVRVVVIEGKVEVADNDGRLWRIGAGEALSVTDLGVAELRESSQLESYHMARLLGQPVSEEDETMAATLEASQVEVNDSNTAMVFAMEDTLSPAPSEPVKSPVVAQEKSPLSHVPVEDKTKSTPKTEPAIHPEATPVSSAESSPAPKPETAPSTVTGIEQWRQWVLEGKLREAEIELRLYLKQHPLDTEAHSLLADCQRKAGKFSNAVETYKNLIAIGSVSQANRARFKAGVLLQEKLRDHFGAASIFEEYLAAGNSSPLLKANALVRLAHSLIALNEKHRAKMLLERVISDHSGTSAAINAREILEQIQQ